MHEYVGEKVCSPAGDGCDEDGVVVELFCIEVDDASPGNTNGLPNCSNSSQIAPHIRKLN